MTGADAGLKPGATLKPRTSRSIRLAPARTQGRRRDPSGQPAPLRTTRTDGVLDSTRQRRIAATAKPAPAERRGPTKAKDAGAEARRYVKSNARPSIRFASLRTSQSGKREGEIRRASMQDSSAQSAQPRVAVPPKALRSRLTYLACEMGTPAGDLGFSDAAFSALRAPTMI
jgi:hypothetical protein